MSRIDDMSWGHAKNRTSRLTCRALGGSLLLFAISSCGTGDAPVTAASSNTGSPSAETEGAESEGRVLGHFAKDARIPITREGLFTFESEPLKLDTSSPPNFTTSYRIEGGSAQIEDFDAVQLLDKDTGAYTLHVTFTVRSFAGDRPELVILDAQAVESKVED